MIAYQYKQVTEICTLLSSRHTVHVQRKIACLTGAHLLKHANHVASVVLNAAICDHLKAAIYHRSVCQVKSNQVHVV